jgi:cytochrome oxidase assembly protein ShyY1
MRTILFTLFMIGLIFTFIQLSAWQWHRHVSRALHNAQVTAAIKAPIVPIGAILPATTTPLTVPEVWRRVDAVGRYDTAHQILVRYRAYEGENGFEVLTPLVTDGGTLWVDRGWVPLVGKSLDDAPNVPAPPSGTVTVTGYLQASETTNKTVLPATGQIRTITLPAINAWYGRPAYGVYLARTAESPSPAAAPRALQTEDLSGGPHVAYTIQWALFAGIGVFGWAKLMRDDMLALRRERTGDSGGGKTGGGPNSRRRSGGRAAEDGADDDETGAAPRAGGRGSRRHTPAGV